MPGSPALRGVTAPELATLRLKHIRVHKQILVEDADGVYQDRTGYLKSARWGESIDQQVASATFTLHREKRDAAGVVQSLAPLMAGSELNRDGDGEYAPAIHPGRGIRYRTATVPAGVEPVDADWVTMFEGIIDTPEWGGDSLTITARDLGAVLQETTVEDLHSYGTAAGVPAETVMQAILTDAEIAAVLDVPTSPGFMVTGYDVNGVSVLDAINTLALQFGWDLRYRFTGRHTSAPLLERPRRDLVTPDAVLDGNDYRTVPSFEIDPRGVRNVIRVLYYDEAAGMELPVQREHAGSIAAFKGRKFMQLAGEAIRAIKTEAEATVLANDSLADLAEPDATQQVEGRYWWPVTLGALLEWTPNGVHYDEPQFLAVTAFEHVHDRSGETTRITTRGKPSGAYKRWLALAGSGGTPDDGAPAPIIGPMMGEGSPDGGLVPQGRCWLPIQFDKNTESIEVYTATGPTSPLDAPPLDIGHMVYLVRRMDGEVASADNWWTVLGFDTDPGHYRKVYVRPVGYAGRTALPKAYEAIALDGFEATLGGFTDFQVTRVGNTSVLTWAAEPSTSPHPVWLLVWRNGLPFTRIPWSAVGTYQDRDLQVSEGYVYELQQWSADDTASALSGPRTSQRRPPVDEEPAPDPGAPVAPEWLETPVLWYDPELNPEWQFTQFEFRYRCEDAVATTIDLEGYDGTAWRRLRSDPNSPTDTEVHFMKFAKQWLAFRTFRLVSRDAGGAALEYSDERRVYELAVA